MRSRPWTFKEEEFVRENYATMPLVEMSRHISRGHRAIQACASRLNVYKSKRKKKPTAPLKPLKSDQTPCVDRELGYKR